MSGTMNGYPIAYRSTGCGIYDIGAEYCRRVLNPIVQKVSPDVIRKYCKSREDVLAEAKEYADKKLTKRKGTAKPMYSKVKEEEYPRIRELFEAKLTVPRIAEMTGRSQPTVRKVLRIYGLYNTQQGVAK